jgi:hypothetical protein
LKFIKTTIFVFPHIKARLPQEIINLEGLYITETTKEEAYGITITHRDGLYPAKTYYFEEKSTQEEWMRQTS